MRVRRVLLGLIDEVEDVDRVEGDDAGDGSSTVRGLRITRQRVSFTDDGSGAASVFAAIGIDDEQAAAVIAAARRDGAVTPGITELDPLVVWVEPGSQPDRIGVRFADEVGGWDVVTADAPDAILGVLTRRRLDAERARPRLHGGAVVDDEGRALLVLGRPGAGKSTLVAHLARGRRLLNDEQITVFADHGRVAGFTRPLVVKPGGGRVLPEACGRVDRDADHAQLVTALDLGSEHGLLGRPALVVLPDRDVADGTLADEVLEPPAALDALCANNLDLVDRPVAALEAFARLATTVPVVRIRCADSSRTARHLRVRFAEPATVPGSTWRVTDHAAAQPVTGSTAAPSPAVISVELDDDVVLYHRESHRLVRLNRTGSAWWRALSTPGVDGIDIDGSFMADLDHQGLVRRL